MGGEGAGGDAGVVDGHAAGKALACGAEARRVGGPAVEEAAAEWEALKAVGHNDEKLASVIYQPLKEKDASKAVAAQYAAHLVATGHFGKGELFARLPPYVQRALAHLTGTGAAS